MRCWLIIALLFNCIAVNAQFPDTGMCAKKPVVDVAATINNFGYGGKIYIGNDSLRMGFRVLLSDPSYQLVGFRVYFFGDNGDLYWRDISGSEANERNLPILKHVDGGGFMEIECVSVVRKGQIYMAKPFQIIISR